MTAAGWRGVSAPPPPGVAVSPITGEARRSSPLLRLAHRGLGVRDFSFAAARPSVPLVAFDGICVLTFDPATLLPTGEVVENGLPEAAWTSPSSPGG